MRWLRVFHWCLVRLERDAGGRGRGSRPSQLDAAVFQITLEVRLGWLVGWWMLRFERFESGPLVFCLLFGPRDVYTLIFINGVCWLHARRAVNVCVFLCLVAY